MNCYYNKISKKWGGLADNPHDNRLSHGRNSSNILKIEVYFLRGKVTSGNEAEDPSAYGYDKKRILRILMKSGNLFNMKILMSGSVLRITMTVKMV